MDEKNFSFTVTEQELNIVSAGLTELPFKVVASLIQKLQGQLNNQTAPEASVTD